jgi:hypothetical protein
LAPLIGDHAMFEHVDVVEMAEAAALPEVMRDRSAYAPFLEAAERVAHERGLVVSGASATRLLLGKELTPDDFTYEFYSYDLEGDTRALADAAYGAGPEGLGLYTEARSEVSKRLMAVFVNERRLFQVTAFPSFRRSGASGFVPTVPRPATFARAPDGSPLNLHVLAPDLQLLDVYASLTNPADAGSWVGLVGVAAALEAAAAAETPTLVRGGRAGPAGRKAASGRDVEAFVREFVGRVGHVEVGLPGVRRAAAELGVSSPELTAALGAVKTGRRAKLVTAERLETEAASPAPRRIRPPRRRPPRAGP